MRGSMGATAWRGEGRIIGCVQGARTGASVRIVACTELTRAVTVDEVTATARDE